MTEDKQETEGQIDRGRGTNRMRQREKQNKTEGKQNETEGKQNKTEGKTEHLMLQSEDIHDGD